MHNYNNLYNFLLGSSVGIILPPDADDDVYDLLENILHGVVSQTAQRIKRGQAEIKEERGISDTISKGLVNGELLVLCINVILFMILDLLMREVNRL